MKTSNAFSIFRQRPFGPRRETEATMALYVISCALRHAAHDYSPLWTALERRGAKRAMEAVWLLDSPDEIASITHSILPMLKDDDRLLIGEIGVWSATHLLEDAQDFLKSFVHDVKNE